MLTMWITRKLPLQAIMLVPILTYFLMSPLVAWPLYSAVLFQPGHHLGSEEPWTQIEKEFNVRRKEVVFHAADGTRLYGWFLKLPNTERTFLVSQGKGGTLQKRSGMVRMLLRCGGSVFVYNYRGYGASEGKPSLDGVCTDASAAYDYLVGKEGIKPERIIAYGESFGTGVTGQLVSKRRVGGVVLQSGFSSLLRAGRDVLPWLKLYPDNWFPAQMMDNVAVFQKTPPPLLIVHGCRDKFVVCENSSDLFAAAVAPKRLLLLPEGSHGGFGKGNEYFDTMKCFLQENGL